MRLVIAVAFAGTLAVWGGGAKAASFDCKAAASRIELLICHDADLNSLDSQLEGAYLGALDRSNHPAQVKDLQLVWLKRRDACADAKCLTAAYLKQVGLLSAMSDEPAICGGPTTPEVDACEAEYAHRDDLELGRYVAAARKRLMEEAKDAPNRQGPIRALAEFDAAQVAWTAFRKAECDAVYDWWSDGTIRGAMYWTCWQAVTELRTTDVWSIWLNYMDNTQALMPKPVSHGP